MSANTANQLSLLDLSESVAEPKVDATSLEEMLCVTEGITLVENGKLLPDPLTADASIHFYCEWKQRQDGTWFYCGHMTAKPDQTFHGGKLFPVGIDPNQGIEPSDLSN